MSDNIAVILAGGSGRRMETEKPKQFLEVAGKSILEYSVETFHSHVQITEIAIVGNATHLDIIEQLVAKNKWTKVKKILNGGRERYESSMAALQIYEGRTSANLIIHDAVRPLVSHRIISDNIKALENYGAVYTAIPSSDTVIEADSGRKTVHAIPDRENIWRAQTPQSFHSEVIRKAYKVALEDPNFALTDDCGVVKKYLPEESIFIVEGDNRNIKVTFKEDLFLMKKYLQDLNLNDGCES